MTGRSRPEKISLATLHTKVDFGCATPLFCAAEEKTSFAPGIDPDATPVIAFDLDETLIVNSWICSAHFDPDTCTQLVSAWKTWSLPWYVSQSRRFRGQSFVRPVIDWLADPDRTIGQTVKLQIRRGTLEVLKALRHLGFRLVLVTASARERVDYLFARLPLLKQFFQFQNLQQVICAEDLHRAALNLATSLRGNFQPKILSGFESSSRLHQTEPPSLAWKTPLLVQRLLDNSIGYDLLVDDNIETRRGFERHGLSDSLVPVDGMAAPDSLLMFEVAEEIFRRIQAKYEVNSPAIKSTLAAMKESKPKSGIWLEDPFYLPLLRKQLELGKIDNA